MRMNSRKGGSRGRGIGRSGVLQSASFHLNQQENRPDVNLSTKLLITNLDSKVNDKDICELFSEIGIIREAFVHYNCWGYSLGTAHVVYLSPEHAAEAARRYNGIQFDGKPMTITLERPLFGNQVNNQTLPVKMRLSFGPGHKANGAPRMPFSQVNRNRALIKTPKRLGNGAKPLNSNGTRGRGKAAATRNQGQVLTAAELDLELDEYLKSKIGKGIKTTNAEDDHGNSADMDGMDDFGQVNEVLDAVETMEMTSILTPKNTPGKLGRARKTPSNTPSANSKNKTPGKLKKESPTEINKSAAAKTSKKTPAKTPNKTPAKTPNKTPLKTPNYTPAKTPNRTPKNTSAKTPAQTPKNTPKNGSVKTPKGITPVKKTPNKLPAKNATPARAVKSRGRTPAASAKQANTPAAKDSPVKPKSVGTPRRSGRALKNE